MKSFFPLVTGLIAATASYAHTAGIEVGTTRFGSVSGAISGYDVSRISYELDGHRVVSVSFALDPPGARTVRVRLSPVGGWHDCSLSGRAAVCEVPEIDAEILSRIDVVASS